MNLSASKTCRAPLISSGLCMIRLIKKLADKRAFTQRLLWASTSTKSPAYSDVKYIDSLIGKDTVNTVPLETLDDYRDHGKPKDRIEEEVVKAQWMLDQLPALGISIDNLTQQLENEGVENLAYPLTS